MRLKPLRVITVGRLHSTFGKLAVEHYAARLRRWRTLIETNVREGDPALSPLRRVAVEGQLILDSLNPMDIPVCLDEKGDQMTSRQFSDFLGRLSENTTRRPCFIIGGAFGLDPEVRKKAKYCLSLSKLTFPYELARVVFFEQLYRAESLLRNSPYHH